MTARATPSMSSARTGRKRTCCKENPSSFNLIRVPVEPARRGRLDPDDGSGVAPRRLDCAAEHPAGDAAHHTQLERRANACLGTKPPAEERQGGGLRRSSRRREPISRALPSSATRYSWAFADPSTEARNPRSKSPDVRWVTRGWPCGVSGTRAARANPTYRDSALAKLAKNSSASFLAVESMSRPPSWAILPPTWASTS